jgi:hypothetical protein
VPASRAARAGRLVLYALVLAAGLGSAFQPTLASRFALLQTDPGDAVFINYVLEHYVQLATRPGYVGSLWSPPFFHPAKEVLAYSENVMGVAPIYAALRAAGPPMLAYQWLLLVLLALTAACMLLLLRRLGVSPALAALGAFCFAFGMWRVAQIGHPQLLAACWSPLALLAVHRLFAAPTRAAFTDLLLLLYLQILSGIYLGWFLLLGFALFIPLYVWLDRAARPRLAAFCRGHALFLAAAALGWLVATYLTLRPYLAAGGLLGYRSWDVVRVFLPRLQSWLAVPEGSVYSRFLRPFPPGTPAVWEHYLFPGFVVLALGIASAAYLARRREDGEPEADGAGRPFLLACWGTALALGLLSFYLPVGGHAVSLWRIVYRVVPGAGAIRAVGRISTVVYLFGLVAACAGADAALRRLRLRPLGQASLAGLILVAGMAEQRVSDPPAFEKRSFRVQVERLRAAIPPGCPSFYAPLRPGQPFFVSQLAAMWAGLEANVPTVNGYSGNSPPGYPNPTRTMSDAELRLWAGAATCVVR